jgi:FMN-dependent NADH-azoreductase
MNLADLLPTVRKLSTNQKLTLIEELKSELESSNETVTAWDLSAESIASRNAATLALLDKWETEEDEQDQTETWEFLQQALDEDRLSSHRPFFS